jgi:transposase-like protein
VLFVIIRRKVVRPDLLTLKQEVSERGYSATGRKYGVSNNAIRKWIKNYKN